MSQTPFQLDDELLSAYIDGQLNDQELREVQVWLDRDEAARALVDELRAVSEAVQSLPRQQVPEQWMEKLAARLDKAATAGSESNDADQPSKQLAPTIPVGQSARGWWWSIAAVAAAVVLVLQFPLPEQNNIAFHEERPKPAGEVVIGSPDSMVETAPSRDGVDDTERTREMPMPSDAMVDEATLDEPDMGRSVDVSSGRGAEMPSAPAVVAESTPPGTGIAAISNNTLENYLIVWADVPSDTLLKEEFPRVLISNGIEVESKPEDWKTAAEPVRRQIARRNAESSLAGFAGGGGFGPTFGGSVDPLSDDFRARRADSARFSVPEEALSPAEREAADEPNEATRGVVEKETAQSEPKGQLIWLETTAGKVVDLLADMENDPVNFGSITVESVVNAPEQAGAADAFNGSIAGSIISPQEPADQDEDSPDPSDRGAQDQEPGGDRSKADSQYAEEQQQSQSNSYQGAAQNKLGKQQRYNARPLKQTPYWYDNNTAPQTGTNTYQLRSGDQYGQIEGQIQAKSQYLQQQVQANSNYFREQRANLNKKLNEVQQYSQAAPEPVLLTEEQPVQVLFVLRNKDLAQPAPGQPAPADAATGEDAR